MREFVRKAFDKASSILAERRALLESCAKQLLARETLTEEELRRLVPFSAQSEAG